MKSVVFGLIALFSVNANAAEITLVCDRWVDGTPEYRTVIVGDGRESVTLEDSSGGVIEARAFAVIIELVLGENGAAPREEFSVRDEGEFALLSGENGYEFSFRDLKEGKKYSCETSRNPVANPALTRSTR